MLTINNCSTVETSTWYVWLNKAVISRLGQEWDALEVYLTKHMSEAYYDPTVDEWLATLVHSPKNAAKQLFKAGDKQLAGHNLS